jgi:hypothetical protein
MATKESVPLRVWLFVLIMLIILAVLAVALFMVVGDPLALLAVGGGLAPPIALSSAAAACPLLGPEASPQRRT